MKATSITQPKDTMAELITQGLSEKFDVAGSQIQNFVFNGALQSATETVRDLTTLLEDLVWQAYLNMLFNCKMILERLKILAGKKGFRFVSYQEIQITLPTGTKIPIRSPFFVKASPKRGRKKTRSSKKRKPPAPHFAGICK